MDKTKSFFDSILSSRISRVVEWIIIVYGLYLFLFDRKAILSIDAHVRFNLACILVLWLLGRVFLHLISQGLKYPYDKRLQYSIEIVFRLMQITVIAFFLLPLISILRDFISK